jgi:hypothetical protein
MRKARGPWETLDIAIRNGGIIFAQVRYNSRDKLDHHSHKEDAAVDVAKWVDVCNLLMDMVKEGPDYELRCDVGSLYSVSVQRDEGDVTIALVYEKGHPVVKSIKRVGRRVCVQINRWMKQQDNNPVGAGHTGLVN